MCINDMVDGLTLYKVYKVVYSENSYYGLTDDYGIYNLFERRRFTPVTEKMLIQVVRGVRYEL